MGYLTPVLLYNDTAHMMKEDPYFTKRLYSACAGDKSSDVSARSYKETFFDKVLAFFHLYRLPDPKKWQGSADCAQVLRSKHADEPRLILIWGNTWKDLSELGWASDKCLEYTEEKFPREEHAKQMLDIATRELKQYKKRISEKYPSK